MHISGAGCEHGWLSFLCVAFSSAIPLCRIDLFMFLFKHSHYEFISKPDGQAYAPMIGDLRILHPNLEGNGDEHHRSSLTTCRSFYHLDFVCYIETCLDSCSRAFVG